MKEIKSLTYVIYLKFLLHANTLILRVKFARDFKITVFTSADRMPSQCIYLSFRKISPDILPSCSPGVFRQKSFRSSTPPPQKVPTTLPAFSTAAVTTTTTTTTSISQNSRGSSAAAANDRCAPRAATPTVTTVPTPVSAVPPRDSNSRAVVGASLTSLTLSRGARATSKQARLGPVLASKMASASSSTIVQGWPNTKDDYELKEVIGKYSLGILFDDRATSGCENRARDFLRRRAREPAPRS